MTTSTTARRPIVHHHPHPPHPPPGRPPRAVLDLGAVPTAPGCARAWTRQILWEWRLADLSDTAGLIVSELTTNAMLTSRREGRSFIRLTLDLDQGELAILVRDFCHSTPQPGLNEALERWRAPRRRTRSGRAAARRSTQVVRQYLLRLRPVPGEPIAAPPGNARRPG
jgi:hypothetical protein